MVRANPLFLRSYQGKLKRKQAMFHMAPGERLAVLKQNHFEYEEYEVLKVVIMGHARLYEVMQEKDAIYMKADFTDEDGMKAAELEGEFAELNGWEAESEAAILLKGLGIGEDLHTKKMADIDWSEKSKSSSCPSPIRQAGCPSSG